MTNYTYRFATPLLIIFLLNVADIFAQNKTLRLNLEQVIAEAQDNAPEANIAEINLSKSHLFYDRFLASTKPSLILNANIPVYNRITTSIAQPDGTAIFKRNQYLSSDFDLTFSKLLPNTGGNIYASTGLRYRTDFLEDTTTTNFASNMIYLGFSQPIFGFNSYKWDKKIQPMIREEAQREYTEQMADIAQQAVNYFFDLYIAQLNYKAAQRDKANAEKLYELAKNRYSVGKIAEADVLQMELGNMQADTRQARADLNIQSSADNLRYFLGINEAVQFELVDPQDAPDYEIDTELALQQAALNRKYTLTQSRQLAESERDMERVKKENGARLDLRAGVGFSKAADRLVGAYELPPEDQESISLGISVPIIDWGKSKIERELAEADRQLLMYNIEQENINFERNILLKIRQLDIIRGQLLTAHRTNEVAAKRYDITEKRYTVGKVDVTELNVALNEQISARQNYTETLRSFWTAHYEIQRLTLYDFENERALMEN